MILIQLDQKKLICSAVVYFNSSGGTPGQRQDQATPLPTMFMDDKQEKRLLVQ